MTRKEKIALLNGLLKGEKPMSCIFSDWPEKTYYGLADDEDNFETEDGEIISVEEVDHEYMNYPKVRIIYEEPEYKEPTDEERKSWVVHKYVNEDGEEVVIEPGSKETALFLSNEPLRPNSGLCATGQRADNHGGRLSLSKLSLSKPDLPPEPPPDPKPPPEPFLSRKDREVMAQGRLYCVR